MPQSPAQSRRQSPTTNPFTDPNALRTCRRQPAPAHEPGQRPAGRRLPTAARADRRKALLRGLCSGSQARQKTMNPFPVQRASQLASSGPQTQWLVEDLWTEQAVGILGGEPKCCKSFLALDVAVSVASGTACLRQFPVRRSGPVLLFPAEDSLAVVRRRLEGIATAARVPLDSLPVEVITAPCLRLDTPADRLRLSATVQHLRPILLILDPLI